MKLEVGRTYTVKNSYQKPNNKYFGGIPTMPASDLHGKTLTCVKLSKSGASAWFYYKGEKFWIKDTHLIDTTPIKIAYNLPYQGKSYLGKSFIITKPANPSTAFWTAGMEQYVGQSVTVTFEGSSKWVRISADDGAFLWHKNWLKPTKKVIPMKLRKLTLQEELANIDSKYDAKIRDIQRQGEKRRAEITRKAESRKKYFAKDRTKQKLDKVIKISRRGNQPKTPSKWYKAAKISLGSLALALTTSGIIWGVLTLI